MTEKKLCMGCAYYMSGVDKCRKFPVEGDYVGNRYNKCQDCREDELKCGKDAKYFEKYVSLHEEFMKYEKIYEWELPKTVNKASGIKGLINRLFLQG